MDTLPFASLAQVKILLVPVGNIPKQTFHKWASLIRSFEYLRLDEIPTETREDRNRFIATPLSSGYLHLSFPSHPPPKWYNSTLSLFRPSHFALGVIGIAECSQDESLSSILAEFNAAVAEYFPANSAYPLATKCYAFEDGDEQSSQINLGNNLPQLVVIPNVMGHKNVYIGTLLGELCADILGDFTGLAKALESPAGLEALNAKILPTLTHADDPNGTPLYLTFNHKKTKSPPNMPTNQFGGLSSSSSMRNSPDGSSRFQNGAPNRSSTLPTGMGSTRSSLIAPSSNAKKRTSVGPAASGRLNKIVADLYLLAGRTADAVQWYVESLPLLKGPQDVIWNASAIEGMCVAEFLDSWTPGDDMNVSTASKTWNDISDRLTSAISLYSRATPTSSPFSPSTDFEDDVSTIALLYAEAVLRQSQLLFSVWSCGGWGSTTFKLLLHPTLPSSLSPRPPPESQLYRMCAVTNISRSAISSAISQAHGPFLMHLKPHDRLRVVNAVAAMYGSLGYKRKEVYVLREVMANVMDMVVNAREEVLRRDRDSIMSNGGGGAGLGIAGMDMGSLTSERFTGAAGGLVAVRPVVSDLGNQAVLKMIKYICEVFGVDLGKVGISSDSGAKETASHKRVSEVDGASIAEEEDDEPSGDPYGWPELQLGVVREAVAVAEALPDHPTVAQFTLSTLKTLHPYLTPSEQLHLYTTSVKALATARRRGDDRRMEYWSGKPVMSVEVTPLDLLHLPIEHPVKDLQTDVVAAAIVPVGGRDPFIYNPRIKAALASQALAVQNEPIEFSLTLFNPFSFDLELQSLSLSTIGPEFNSPPTTALIPAESYRIVSLSGVATQPGTLVIRGVKAQLSGGTFKEFLLPLLNDEDEGRAEKKKSARDCEAGRIKWSGLDARSSAMKERERRRLLTTAGSADATKAKGKSKPNELEFLTCKVVEEQPLLRVRRATLTQGAVMLYDGETTIIRLTLENISNIPVDFVKLTFEDSTIQIVQQILQEGDVDAIDAYELEWDLANRPVLRWDGGECRNGGMHVGPGKKAVVGVRCFGKFGCSNGTIHISYSYANRPQDPSSSVPREVFHTRQIIYPVLVTVYNTLGCSAMDIVPFWRSESALPDAEDDMALSEEEKRRRALLSGAVDASGRGYEDWCLFTMDVRNVYGVPFEVTFERHQEDIPQASSSRLVSPGSTVRMIVPLKRLSLPRSVSNTPIPTLSNRQFVVSKSKLSPSEETLQRELFWYREELLKVVKAKWRQPGTTRHGDLSLHKHRLSPSMLDALRVPRCRVELTLEDYGGQAEAKRVAGGSSKWTVKPREFVYLRAKVTNQSDDILRLRMSYVPLPLTIMDPVLFDGSMSHISLDKLPPGQSAEVELGVCFVDEGKFEFCAELEELVAGSASSPAGTAGGLVEATDAKICIVARSQDE